MIRSETDGLKSRKPEDAGVDRKTGTDQTRLWIAVGAAAAAAALITGVAFAVFLSPSTSNKESGSSGPTIASRAEKAGGSQASQSSSISSPPKTPVAKPSALPTATDTAPPLKTAQANEKTSQQTNEAAPDTSAPASTSELANPASSQSQAITSAAGTEASALQPAAPRGIFAAQKFDTARLARRVARLDYAQGKNNLEKARARRGEIVVPGGMYSLARASADNPAGARKYVVTECSLEEKGSKKLLAMTAHGSSEIEVEPRLARELESVNSDFLDKSVAILTLFIDNSGEFGLVRAELLEECTPRLKKGFGIGQADVEYKALTVSPEGAKSNTARDEDWQRVGRMNMFFVHWKRRVEGMNKLRQTINMTSLTNVMGSMYADAMKGVAAAGADERARQRAISGR